MGGKLSLPGINRIDPNNVVSNNIKDPVRSCLEVRVYGITKNRELLLDLSQAVSRLKKNFEMSFWHLGMIAILF